MIKRFPIVSADVFAKTNVGTSEQRQQLLDEAWGAFMANDAEMSLVIEAAGAVILSTRI